MHRRLWIFAVAALLLPACHCESASVDVGGSQDTGGLDTDVTTSTWGVSGVVTVGSSEESTGAPFDASRWIGRYHYENVFLPFGERGDPGDYMLVNFEIFSDSTATMFFDHCAFDEGVFIEYKWTPDDPGWLALHPGAGESSLRLAALDDLETLRVRLIEPCRDMEFEADGAIVPWFPFRPGESCWIDRCTTGSIMQVDYCEGEESLPCP